jgi:hypothetical protein
MQLGLQSQAAPGAVWMPLPPWLQACSPGWREDLTKIREKGEAVTDHTGLRDPKTKGNFQRL